MGDTSACVMDSLAFSVLLMGTAVPSLYLDWALSSLVVAPSMGFIMDSFFAANLGVLLMKRFSRYFDSVLLWVWFVEWILAWLTSTYSFGTTSGSASTAESYWGANSTGNSKLACSSNRIDSGWDSGSPSGMTAGTGVISSSFSILSFRFYLKEVSSSSMISSLKDTTGWSYS